MVVEFLGIIRTILRDQWGLRGSRFLNLVLTDFQDILAGEYDVVR